MALDNSWMNSGRDQQRDINPVEHQQQEPCLNSQRFDECGPSNRGGLLKIPSSNFKAQTSGSENKCSMIQQQPQPQQHREQRTIFTQTEQRTIFTQTEQNRFPYGDSACKSDVPGQPVFDPTNLQQQRNMYEDGNKPICHPMVAPSGIGFQKQKENEEKFKQDMGPKDFPFCYNMNMLQKVQGDDKCYRFDMCGQQFSYNYALMNQVSLTPFKCEDCGLVFSHSSLLNHHKRIHMQTHTCDVCGLGFAQASELRSHKTVHAEGKHKCEICGVEFPDQARLKKHAKFHNNTQRTKCDSCEDSFAESSTGSDSKPTRRILGVRKCQKCHGSGMVYMPSSTKPPKPFQCSICENTFSRYSSLWSHKRLHSGEKPFKCEVCGMAFAKAAYLKNHRHIHTGEKPYKCAVCNMAFSQGPHLKNHERIHTGEKPYICEVCHKAFSRHSTLWNHRRIHTGERPYRCDICGKAFSQGAHLKNHKQLHTGEKPYRCEVCGMAFAKTAYLDNHRRVHTGEKPYKCDVCEKAFSQGPHLKNHERIHTGEKPYVCGVCHKAFSRHSTLWNHRRIHLGEKPYRCEICGSAFSQGAHLKNHKKVHTGEKPYRCDVCEVGFSDRFALKRHKNIHNNPNNNANTHSHNQNTQFNAPQSGLDLPIYKCEVGQVAFPGCSRPPETKPIHAT